MIAETTKVVNKLSGLLHDSDLGMRLRSEVEGRLPRLDEAPLMSFSKAARSAASDCMTTLPPDRASFRNYSNPDVIGEEGGLCLEYSAVAEAAFHLLYSESNRKPKFEGRTSILIFRMYDKTKGKMGDYHAVLGVLGVDAATGEQEARIIDALTGIECSYEEFMSGTPFADRNSRPEALIGKLPSNEMIHL
jgi:hypothetical protein